MIWRDDDVNVYTDAYRFKELHKVFIDKGEIHTAAVIMKDLWENHALFYYLATAPNLDIGLHGWEHKDYSVLNYDECYGDIKKSLDYWKENSERMTGQVKPITTFFAPWNRHSNDIRQACAVIGLKFCSVQNGEWKGEEVRSFHHWNAITGWDIQKYVGK